MCGILGGWTHYRLESALVEAALNSILHRGPDDQGVCRMGNMLLGMRRLSIIDPLRGKQPVFTEDRRTAVVLNGEVYNYKELMADLAPRHQFGSQSDTESIVHLYEERFTDTFAQLRGMFAVALADQARGMLVLARDRFGKKPLYYAIHPERGLIFASEIKALKLLLGAWDISLTISPQAISDYLSLGFVPQPDTIYKEIRMLEPGHWAAFDGRTLKSERYWTLRRKPVEHRSYEDLLVNVRREISKSVALRLRSDVPLGVFLSAGLDSSIVAYEAAKLVGDSLNTFTVKMPDSSLDEGPEAARTAMELGVKNHQIRIDIDPLNDIQFVVRHWDQPFADSSALPSYAISKCASSMVKVALNGDGGDELFGGYRRHIAAYRHDTLKFIPTKWSQMLASACEGSRFNRRALFGFALRFLRGMGSDSFSERYLIWSADMMRSKEKALYRKVPALRETEDLIASLAEPGATELDDFIHLDVRLILLSCLLVKMDMATMAASVEARSPLLDHVLAELSATIPGRMLLKGGRSKAVLRDAYRGHLRNNLISAPKKGFEVPMTRWLKHELKPLVMDTLGASNSLVGNWLDRSYVQKLLQNENSSGVNWEYRVYSLLVLELWLRQQ